MKQALISKTKAWFLYDCNSGNASRRQAWGHIGDGCVKWEHFLNDVADQMGMVQGHIERVEMSLKCGFHMTTTVIDSMCR